MAEQYIYVMKGLRKMYPPQREVLKNIWLSFFPGAKIGVLGLNGAGKSTLLKIMAGVETEFDGEAWPAKGTKVGYLSQEPQLDAAKTVLGNVEEAVAETRALLVRFDEVSERFGEEMSDDAMTALMEEQGKLQDEIEAKNAWDLDRQLEIAMDALRLPPRRRRRRAACRAARRRRVALCRLLLRQARSAASRRAHQPPRRRARWPGSRRSLWRTSSRHRRRDHPRPLLPRQRRRLDPRAGPRRRASRGRAITHRGWSRRARGSRKKKRKRAIVPASGRWPESGSGSVMAAKSARQAKGKARLNAYEKLFAADADFEQHTTTHEIHIPAGPRLGDLVIEAQDLTKGFGDKLLIENLSFNLPPAGIVGVIGPNGAGKTTLFRMITGADEPDSGKLRLGKTVSLSYVDQSRDALDGEKRVWEVISDGQEIVLLGKREINARAYASWFNFTGADQQKHVKNLSGGERNRVHLARTLKAGGNVLLLDEPTNDLDVDTLRGLEEALLEFAGCAVVISHDRWFLDRIATHILAFEGDSQVVWFEGNYEAYEADRKRRLGTDADQPHRIKYRKLKH